MEPVNEEHAYVGGFRAVLGLLYCPIQRLLVTVTGVWAGQLGQQSTWGLAVQGLWTAGLLVEAGITAQVLRRKTWAGAAWTQASTCDGQGQPGPRTPVTGGQREWKTQLNQALPWPAGSGPPPPETHGAQGG